VNSDREWDWGFAEVCFFALSPYFLSKGSSRKTVGVAMRSHSRSLNSKNTSSDPLTSLGVSSESSNC
jgi:hypothetical protein